VPALAQQQEINRALIQRDQQSAEFAARLRGSQSEVRQLENLHAQQLRDALQPLSPEPGVAQQLLPYQRNRMAQERGQQRFASPIFQAPEKPAVREPLPLPGGPKPGVDPVAPEGVAR